MKKGMSLKKRRMLTGFVFVFPWLIGFLLFFGGNLIQTINYSLSKLKLIPEGGYTLEYIGSGNFKTALTQHGSFNRVLVESIGNMIINVPLIIFFSLFVALLINKKFHGRTLVRAILFLPVIMTTGAVMAAMNSALTQVMGGLSNVSSLQDTATKATVGLNASYLMGFLTQFGLPKTIGQYIIDAISRIFEIVRASGVQILIFLAALQSISSSMYEVAKIEGATSYETFWKITFPMVSPLIVTNMVYTIVDLYSRTDIIKMASTTAFTDMNFGLSAAMSLLSSGIVCIVIAISVYLVSKKVFYNN